jgi:hypothetical protein
MPDALTALEEVSAALNDLAALVAATRAKFVDPAKAQPIARRIAQTYYESAHAELEIVQHRAGLTDEIEFVIGAILELTSAPRKKSAYARQLKEIRPYIRQATVDVMRARGKPRLVLSETERSIYDTLSRMLPATCVSYEQVLRDIAEGKRVSWRGPGTELREVLREVIDHLAPDDQVMAAPGFRLEGELTRPTQKQKVRFILKARRAKSATAEASLDTFEEGVANLARSTYQRGNVSTHVATDGREIRRLKGYVDAVLVDLLEVSS